MNTKETRRSISKRVSAIVAVTVVLLLPAFFSGCGYQMVTGKGIYGGEISSLYVPVFKNKSYEPHASMYVTDAFTRELMDTGLFTMNKEGSDAYLEGLIKAIRKYPYTVNQAGFVSEKRVDIYVELTLYRNNGVMIRKWNLKDYETYRVDNLNYEESYLQEALGKVSGRLARRFSAALLMEY
jgi:outer membrane lipopolysaccharide assembly protein LptE/RlpB